MQDKNMQAVVYDEIVKLKGIANICVTPHALRHSYCCTPAEHGNIQGTEDQGAYKSTFNQPAATISSPCPY